MEEAQRITEAAHSKPIIESCFERFLLESASPEEREFLDEEEQIREIFVHSNYLSQQDIDIAKDYPIDKLKTDENFTNINALFSKMHELYADED